jgi:hypothetical protein
MQSSRLRALPILLIAAAGLVIGLAIPAAAHEASSLINGNSIKIGSIPGNRLVNNGLTGKQINESTLGTVPRAKTAATLPPLQWHPITTLENGWVAVTASGGPGAPAYAVDAQGIVHLQGAIGYSGTSGQPAFTLPANLSKRSALWLAPIVCAGPAIGYVSITTDGTVTINDIGSSQCTALAVLDGLTFTAK